jgi:hypothetical protein
MTMRFPRRQDSRRPIFVVLIKVNGVIEPSSGPTRLYALASASVARVKAKRGGGASPSDMIGQNGMQLNIPMRMVVISIIF